MLSWVVSDLLVVVVVCVFLCVLYGIINLDVIVVEEVDDVDCVFMVFIKV